MVFRTRFVRFFVLIGSISLCCSKSDPVTGPVWPRGWVALLFHDHGRQKGVSGQQYAPAALYPGKDPVLILQEVGWAPRPVWTGGKSRPHRDSISDRPARSQSLYRLSYPAHRCVVVVIKKSYSQNTTIYSITKSLLHVSVTVTIIRQTFQYMDMTCSVLTVWDPYCLHLLCRKTDIQVINYSVFNTLTNAFSEILTDRPTSIGSHIISENALFKIFNIGQFII